jgi:CSLREA domain-containing protein
MYPTPLSALRLSAALGFASLLAAPTLAQSTFVVNTTEDTVDVNPGDGICADAAGACSLRAAVQEANALAVDATIQLQAGATYALTLTGGDEELGATGDLDIDTNMVIFGQGATIDAMGTDRALDVLYRNAVTIRNLTIINGAVTDASGGGIRVEGSLTVMDSTIRDCSALGMGASGGGIFNNRGFLLVDDSLIENCEASRAGGAIEVTSQTSSRIRRSELNGNTTGPMPGNGGAVHMTGDGRLLIRSSLMENNSAASEGGGLWNSGSGFMVAELCAVRNNEALGTGADNGGGGIFNDGGTMSVSLCEVSGNRAMEGSGSGGGLFNNEGTFTLELSQVIQNECSRAGGGMEVVSGTTTVFATQFSANSTMSSPGNGGAVHQGGAGQISFDQCAVENNFASLEGGGLWNSASSTMVVRGCSLDGNEAAGASADTGGGGLFNDGGTMEVSLCVVSNNLASGASGSGGGLMNNFGTMTVTDTRVFGNASNRAGGGIEANVGTTTLARVLLANNVTGAAPGNGGGLHLTGAGLVVIGGSTIVQNAASAEGGGLWNSATGTMTVTGSTIMDNTAPIGDDLFNDGGTFTVDGNDVP